MKEIVVGSNEAGQRLDKLLAKVLNRCSKSFLYKMLRKKNIKLNNTRAEGKELLQTGDTIQIYFSDETYEKFAATPVQKRILLPDRFCVIYEDQDVVFMNKWAGVLSQKAAASDISMNEYLVEYALQKQLVTQKQLASFTPSISNRLDYNTTGLLAGGVSLRGLQVLAEAFRQRSLKKYYYALVAGNVHKDVAVKAYLKKDHRTNKVTVSAQPRPDAEYIETHYQVLDNFENATLLKVHLVTGKPHQIRAHLAYLQHPVIGDVKYGEEKINTFYKKNFAVTSQLLHAAQLVFPETFALPDLAGKTLTAPLPERFERVVLKLRESKSQKGGR